MRANLFQKDFPTLRREIMEVKEISSDKWDELVKKSPQGTIFSTLEWCSLFDDLFKMYVVTKGDEVVGGIIGFLKDGFISGGYPFTLYQGILINEPEKYTTKMSLHNEVAKVLIQQLTTDYDKVSITNHYTYPDIRPFLWNGWKPTVSYTYILKPNWEALEKDTRNLIRSHTKSFEECKPDKFIELYLNTFKRKNVEGYASEKWLDKFFQTFNPIMLTNGTAAVCLIYDTKRIYYIFGASEADNSSFAVMWEAFSKFKEIDLVGCNLPEIGHYKRGFGGELKTCLGIKLG